MDNTLPRSLARFGIILGIALIISAAVVALTFYRIRSLDNTLSVTGSARMDVVADQVKWTSNISRTARASTLKEGYAALDRDMTTVKAFLTEQGISQEQVTISPVFMNEVYTQNPVADKEYNLTQSIEIQSADVAKITALANSASQLINKGVIFSSNSPEYYYSKLPEVRVSLLSDAIVDARARAEEIAGAGGQNVGKLKSAQSGVVQVMSRNSVDVSDYGAYDTSRIEKTIMVTVKTTFTVR